MHANFQEKYAFKAIKYTICFILITTLIFSTVFSATSIKIIYGQNNDSNSNNNMSSSSDSTKSIEKLRTVNLKQLAEEPDVFESYSVECLN